MRTLAALPPRQLNLLAIGAIAIAIAIACTAIRAPLAGLRVQRARLAALVAVQAAASTPQAAGGQTAPAPLPSPAAAPTLLALIAAVSGAALDTGVAVASAVPGPERTVAGLRQQTLEIEASGNYVDLLAWITAIEASQPTVGLIRMDMVPAPEAPQRQVRLQLGVYSVGKQS